METQKSNDSAAIKVGLAFVAAHGAISLLLDHDRTDSPLAQTEPDSTQAYTLSPEELSELPVSAPAFPARDSFALPPITPFQPDLTSTANSSFSSPVAGLGSGSGRLFPGAGLDPFFLNDTELREQEVLEAIQTQLETIRAEMVSESLVLSDGSLREGVAEKIALILERQNNEEVHWEVFGVIDVEDKTATFSIVRTEYTRNLAEALEHFQQGDPDSIPVLREALSDFKEIHGTYLASDSFHFLIIDSLDRHLQTMPLRNTFADEQLRANIVELFKELVTDGFTIVKGTDIPEELRHFEAIFHVHPNGSAPSPPDLASNRIEHIPDLVISPQTDESVKLFLVSEGYCKLLFKGQLKPPETQ